MDESFVRIRVGLGYPQSSNNLRECARPDGPVESFFSNKLYYDAVTDFNRFA